MGKDINRVRKLYFEHIRLVERVEELEAIATKVSPIISGMPHGSSGASKDDTWAKLMDYKVKMADELNEYIKASEELDKEIEAAVHNHKIRTVLKCRYINCMTVQNISDKLCTDLRYTYRLIEKGNKIYADKYSEAKEP